MSTTTPHSYVLRYESEHDASSLSNPHQIFTQHLHLQLGVDFTSYALRGEAIHTLKVCDAGVERLVLDSSELQLHSVHLLHADTHAALHEHQANPQHTRYRDFTRIPLKFHVEPSSSFLGSALSIELPSLHVRNAFDSNTPLLVSVAYATTGGSSGLQFLLPAQTDGQLHPYLFSQFQPTHARSAIPLQDTPSRKFTYSARLTVPKPLIALMSAPNLSINSVPSEEDDVKLSSDVDAHTFAFFQPIPIPSYLIAFVVGALERREISPRCAVWSEALNVDAGLFEFVDTERFLQVAESIAGPYVWQTYDILLCPKSFAYGGMENPGLTFCTPTLLTGDEERPLATVVAHEISHSWAGNLVTSHTWEHFWLNEGFTVFLERKILKQLKGFQVSELDAELGWRSLEEAIERMGADHDFTILNVPLKGRDPDDAFSTVPYESGFNLLLSLEKIVGEPNMLAFLKAYFAHFAFSTCTTQGFVDFFLSFFSNDASINELKQFNWHARLHEAGAPPRPVFDATLLVTAQQLAAQWIAEGESSSIPASSIKGWNCDQTVILLQDLRTHQKQLSDPKSMSKLLEKIDSVYQFSQSKNCEIRFEWLQLLIHSQMSALYPQVVAMLTSQGRMKYTRPLYRALFAAGAVGKELAIATFTEHRRSYHPICSKMVARDLGL